jgi:uncharacterized membrane protein HdeD (DUF308 family)
MRSMRPPAPGSEPPSLPRWLWAVTGLRALVAGTLGVAVLLGNLGRPALANFIAVYWLVGSMLTLRIALTSRSRTRTGVVAAMVGTVAALLVLARMPLRHIITVDTLLPMLGVAAILTGVLRLGGGFRDDLVRPDRPRVWRQLVLGALEIVLGIVLLTAQEVSRTVAIVIAVWGIVGGTTLVVDALVMRRIARSRR